MDSRPFFSFHVHLVFCGTVLIQNRNIDAVKPYAIYPRSATIQLGLHAAALGFSEQNVRSAVCWHNGMQYHTPETKKHMQRFRIRCKQSSNPKTKCKIKCSSCTDIKP